MRRWRVISANNTYFNTGDIIILLVDDRTSNPWFCLAPYTEEAHACSTYKLVEIDKDGNTIRTYEKGDKLNEGALVGGTMNKDAAMKRLEDIENLQKDFVRETAELKKIIESPDRVIYNKDRVYIAWGNTGAYILFEVQGRAYFMNLNGTVGGWNSLGSDGGQAALDNMYERQMSVKGFPNRQEALLFFLSKC